MGAVGGGEDRGRGQTTVDFAMSMGVFFIALTIAIAFVSGMLSPFQGGGQEDPLLADRLASQLTDYQLAGEHAGTLNTTCTLWFFNTSGAAGPCASFDAGDDLETKLNVGERAFVNITIEQNVSGDAEPELLCKDGGSVVTCSGGVEKLALGDSPPSHSSTTIARRAVLLDGRQGVLVIVRVWS